MIIIEGEYVTGIVYAGWSGVIANRRLGENGGTIYLNASHVEHVDVAIAPIKFRDAIQQQQRMVIALGKIVSILHECRGYALLAVVWRSHDGTNTASRDAGSPHP